MGGTISSPDILLSNVEFSWSLITSHLSGHSKGGEVTYLFTLQHADAEGQTPEVRSVRPWLFFRHELPPEVWARWVP